ncbi:hypothetical protein V1264_007812 [Littorina saxatilis]
MMDTFKDTQEDSEMRIAAYLAVMTCPDDVILQQVQRVLEDETDQQVGSFVWSHLSNLQESSSPHKQAVRQLLKKTKLPAKFDLGRLQFSRNYEGSAFLKRLNSGAGAEGNLVWSSSSSLPRSASANITVDLFGRSLNLLDVGLRLEGLEYLLETLLGPYGYFGDKDSAKKADSKLDDLKGSMYMRMFGNEMTFQRFQGLQSITSATSFNMLDFLIKLSKDHDISMTHSMEFLDTEMTVPTSVGLPLSLTVKGTATMDLKASGKMDLRKVSAQPRSLTIDGEFRPSGAVRVSGTMSVDAMVSRAALHVTGTLHSSSALKVRVDLDRGRVLSVELDVPEEKMEIFAISSEFSIVHNQVEKKQQMITENRQSVKMCTGDVTSHITGLELCGELQYPNASTSVSGPYFPLTGPTSLSVTLYKRDTHTSYKLLAKRVENKKKTMAQLSFNTPGSKVDRSMAFDLVINHADKQLEVSAASPWKKAEFKGAITQTKKLMGVSGSFITDDVNTYAVTSEVKIEESKNGVTYTPLVEIRRPEQENMALTGLVTLETPKAATVDLTLTGVTAQPMSLKTALTNTKKEVSLVGSVANGDKQVYSVRVGSQMSVVMGKKNTKIQVTPFLSVKSPRRELVSASGSALYNQGKILKADMALRLLNYKPASAMVTLTKAERKAAVRYIGKVNVKSSLVSSKMDTIINVKKGRLINGRSTLAYNVPRVARDKLVLTAKLSDRSTKAYNKYTVRSSLDSKSFPDYNTAVKLNVDHKKKLSAGELEVKYGSNPQDKNKRVLLSATLARKIKNLYNMDLSYKMEAEAPEQNIDIQVKGKHSHTPTKLDSNVAMTYAKGKDMSASLTLRDKSAKLKKMNGALTLQAPGAGLTLKSDLTQASQKQWEHNLNIKTDGGSKHSISTVYKTPGARAGDVSTTLSLDGMKPLTLSAQANLDLDDLQLAGSLKHGKDVYGVSGSHKLVKSRSGKWNVEVTVPSRRVTLNAEAGKVKGNYEASLEAAWDADKDKNAKVTIEGMAGSKSSKDSSSHKARLSLDTPLQGWTTLVASVGLDSTNTQHQLSTKVVMGNKKNVITSSLVMATPFNIHDIDLSFKAETPYKAYGSMGLALTHKLDSGLNTKLTASLQKDQCEISLTAQNRGTTQSRDLEAQLNIKSNIRKTSLRSLSVAAAHKDDGSRYDNNVDIKLNGQAYSYVMSMNVDSASNTGKIDLSCPYDQLKSTWSQRLTPTDLTSTTTATWGADKRVQLDVTGNHVTGFLGGSVALQTPWEMARNWRAEMKNQYGAGKIVSSSSVKKAEREVMSHSFNSVVNSNMAESEFIMTSPWTQPIRSKVNAKYANFPMTSDMEFSWEPRKKVTAEGSVSLNSWDNLDINMKVTTPMRSMRSVAAQVSNKVEGSEVVGQVIVDLGMRKNIALTTRVQRDITGARAKLVTPWDEMRVMDTGFEVNVQAAAGKVNVDFKAVPLVARYEAGATWSLDDEFNARLRLDTPREDFPYLQILASSKDKRRVRVSRVEVEYDPRHTYSLESTYALTTPLVLDVSVNTPLSGYESFSASLRHNMRDSAMDASAQVTYFNDQTMKATAVMDWSRGLDSSVTVTTPFAGWEKSSATVRHEGEWDDFNSLADVTVGGQGVTGNLKFLNKMKTDAQLSVSTPWAGWEKIEVGVTCKGDLSNMRGTAMLTYGDQKMAASLLNKWNSRKARFVASLSTPFTHDLKVNVEKTGDLQGDVSVSYGRAYSVDASGSGSYNSREATASGSVKYRLGGARHTLAASLAQTGSLQDLALTASASLDKQEVSVTAEFNTLRDIKAALALRTTFSGWESLGASFHNTGDLSAMTTEANVQYMTDKNVNAKMELTYRGPEQLSFRATLTSPLSGLERSVVSLSHVMGPKMCSGAFNFDTTVAYIGPLDASFQMTGHLNNMQGEAHVTYNSQSLLNVNLAHKLSASRLQSSMRVLTPVLPELNVELSHSGSSSDFTTKAMASAGGDKVSSETTWSVNRDNMDLAQSFLTVLEGEANKATITLSRYGPLSDVTVQLTGNLNARKAKVTGNLSTLRDVMTSLKVELPLDGYRQLGASFSKSGEPSDMSVVAAANMEDKKMEVTGKFSSQNDVTGSLDVTTPFSGYSQMGGSLKYGEDNAMISGHFENKKIEANARFNNQNDLTGSLDVTTPFSGYSLMGASFNYGVKGVTASAHVEEKKVEAVARLDTADGVTASLDISTPFPGYTQLAAHLQHSGDLSDLSVTAKGNVETSKAQAALKFTNGQDLSGSLDISTPFSGYRKMGSSFTLTPDLTDMTFIAEAFVQGKKTEVKAKLSQASEMTGSVEVITPFAAYRQMGASFLQRGDLSDLSLQLAANLLNDKIEASAAFVNKDDVTGSVTMATPFHGFRQVGASFKHSGSANNFNSEGQIMYMDGQQISAKANYYNYNYRRIETSAELKTPFGQWEMTRLSYKHAGSPDNFECNAALECSQGHKHTADLKVNLRKDQSVQLTVKTPYDGFRMTELTHSLSMSDNSAQWNGMLAYGQGQRASSQLTVSKQGDQFSSRFDLQTPFTSDLTATVDQQGDRRALSRKITLKYGDNVQYAEDLQWTVNESPLWLLHWARSYTYYDVSNSIALSLRREGAWNDVTMAAKGEMNGEHVGMDVTFKNEFGRVEGNVKVNTPFEGYNDVGASFQHIGELSSSFNSEAKVEFTDGQEVTGKLDFMRATWRRLEVTTQLSTPFEDWTQTQAEYRHTADNDGFTCFTAVEYLDDQRVTGDLRVTSSPNPEMTLTLKTPFKNWEQMSANAAYQNDGWGKKEASSKLDLGRGYVYTVTSALTSSDDSGNSVSTRVTTPHADWHTLEARLSHAGHAQDFKSSAYLSTPILDAVSAAGTFRYTTPFDFTATASLDTPFDTVKDWKMEMINGERGTQKTSHVILGWSGDQEVVMDGTWRHDNSWYERHLHTDVTLVTPFDAVRNTNWMLEHHATQGKYEQKMAGSLNGDKLVDLDLATVNGDLPEMTLTLREPYAMLYSLSRTSDGAEATLDWDRNDPSSNVRLTSRFTGSTSDVANTQHDLELKAIQPSRTVGMTYTLQSSPQNTASQGELYWGRGSNHRLSYVLDFSDLSRRSSNAYEGKVKVGLMSRAVQLSGKVSRSPLSRQMDATFHWDADRDDKKQVAVKTSWTSGDKNKADVTLSLPAIDQEVRVQSEVAVKQGKTLLDATTAVTYSQDASKVLTLSSTLHDTTGAWDSGSNYTLHLTLTHPHTDLDLAMTSHLGASNDRYSAAVDTWYLTSRRERKNMALRGEIDQLRRLISMEMVSPVKKMSMKGEVKSVEPYSLTLTNTYDDDKTIRADVTLDTAKRSFNVKTNYDLAHPERTLVMKAYYVNDTAFKAEMYRDHVTDVITDALLAVRLNTSTLLHSRLHWRSASLNELQEYAIQKLSSYASRSKTSAQSVSEAVREEVEARYSRSTAALAEDLRPLMELVDSEMNALGAQLHNLRRALNRVYRRNPYLSQMGTAATQRFMALQDYLGQVSDSYQQKVQELSQQIKGSMDAMTLYPVGEKYQEAVKDLLQSFGDVVDSGVDRLTHAVVSLDSYLLEARRHTIHMSDYVTEVAHNVSAHPTLQYLRNSLDFTPYIETAANRLRALRMPEQYSSAIYSASSRMNEAVSDVIDLEAMKQVKQAYSEVYQQGAWAYKYWQVEENMKNHLHSIATLLKEIVQEEMEIYTRHFRFLQKSHVTVWDPEHGEIQVETQLPVAMETLDSMPDVTPLVEQYNDVVDTMVPDMDTVQYFYDNYVPKKSWWSNNTTTEDKPDQLMAELKDYTPAKSPRKLYKRKYNKRAPAVAAI